MAENRDEIEIFKICVCVRWPDTKGKISALKFVLSPARDGWKLRCCCCFCAPIDAAPVQCEIPTMEIIRVQFAVVKQAKKMGSWRGGCDGEENEAREREIQKKEEF